MVLQFNLLRTTVQSFKNIQEFEECLFSFLKLGTEVISVTWKAPLALSGPKNVLIVQLNLNHSKEANLAKRIKQTRVKSVNL